MVINRRPIVHFETLRRVRYDQQVREIMAAKTDYILFATEADLVETENEVTRDAPNEISDAERQTKPTESIDLPTAVVQAEILEPKKPIAKTQPVIPEVTPKAKASVTSTPVTPEANKAAVKKENKPQAQAASHPENMTGLGLSLDSIFGEETQAAKNTQSNYFKDSK
ncbi:hypothetical protein [Weissella minor]|uniref:Uncharacterized protein n=1 Tax=Weissella minor TaxID=1620 RepID=A0A0R2JSM1_9LACO|nr:hypothetical protein [Weissella minor]KRN77117.1 hypothetical protein IV67_GL000637 [Weissella minor]